MVDSKVGERIGGAGKQREKNEGAIWVPKKGKNQEGGVKKNE